MADQFILIGTGHDSGGGGTTEAADWLKRSTAPAVVWAHNFDTANEVNFFRWGNGQNNQPVDPDGSVTWEADGFAGGGCCSINFPAGGQTGFEWHRPMSALNAASTGRSSNDPAVGGTLPVRSIGHTAGVDASWTFRTGFYGCQAEQDAVGNTWQGNTDVWDGLEFWFQCRIKFPSSRWAGGVFDNRGSGTGQGNPQGKLIFIDVMPLSGYQELLVRSPAHYAWNAGPTGVFDMYTVHGSYYGGVLGNPQGAGGSAAAQPGGPPTHCTVDHSGVQDCWEWPADEWVTVLFHVMPGRQNDFFNPPEPNILNMPFDDTAIEVWIQRAADTDYTKIWDKKDYRWYYDSSGTVPNVFNAIKFSGYMNGVDFNNASYQRYTQLIFSQDWIPPVGQSAPAWWTS